MSTAGITIGMPHGSSDLAWELFHKIQAADDLVLLYTAVNQYLPFPRRFFASETDWQEFRRRALLHVPANPPNAGLPVLLRAVITWIIVFVLVLIAWIAIRR